MSQNIGFSFTIKSLNTILVSELDGVLKGDILTAQMIGLLLSNSDGFMNPSKELFSVSLLAYLSQKASQFSSLQLFFKMISCVIPMIDISVDVSQNEEETQSNATKNLKISSCNIWLLLFLSELLGCELAVHNLLVQLYSIYQKQCLQHNRMILDDATINDNMLSIGTNGIFPCLLPSIMTSDVPSDLIEELTSNVYQYLKKYELDFKSLLNSQTSTPDAKAVNKTVVSTITNTKALKNERVASTPVVEDVRLLRPSDLSTPVTHVSTSVSIGVQTPSDDELRSYWSSNDASPTSSGANSAEVDADNSDIEYIIDILLNELLDGLSNELIDVVCSDLAVWIGNKVDSISEHNAKKDNQISRSAIIEKDAHEKELEVKASALENSMVAVRERLRKHKNRETSKEAERIAREQIIKERLRYVEVEAIVSRIVSMNSLGHRSSTSSTKNQGVIRDKSHENTSPAVVSVKTPSKTQVMNEPDKIIVSAMKESKSLSTPVLEKKTAEPVINIVKEAQLRAKQRIRERKSKLVDENTRKLQEQEFKRKVMWEERDKKINSFLERQKDKLMDCDNLKSTPTSCQESYLVRSGSPEGLSFEFCEVDYAEESVKPNIAKSSNNKAKQVGVNKASDLPWNKKSSMDSECALAAVGLSISEKRFSTPTRVQTYPNRIVPDSPPPPPPEVSADYEISPFQKILYEKEKFVAKPKPDANSKVQFDIMESLIDSVLQVEPSQVASTGKAFQSATSSQSQLECVLVIKVLRAHHIPEALGEMRPYIKMDWETRSGIVGKFFGGAHTQAVRSEFHSSSGGSVFDYNCALKFRVPYPRAYIDTMHSTGKPLLHFVLQNAPELSVRVFNRNESVSDELLCQSNISDIASVCIKQLSGLPSRINGIVLPLENMIESDSIKGGYVVVDMYIE